MEAPNIKKCPKCGATWMEDQLYWPQVTKEQTNTQEFSGDITEDVELCINDMRGKPHGGDTWAKRLPGSTHGLK